MESGAEEFIAYCKRFEEILRGVVSCWDEYSTRVDEWPEEMRSDFNKYKKLADASRALLETDLFIVGLPRHAAGYARAGDPQLLIALLEAGLPITEELRQLFVQALK